MRMLDTFGLQPKQKIKSMSKGMQEKLQLILVMCRNAKLYISMSRSAVSIPLRAMAYLK